MTETVTIERMGYGPEAIAHLSNGKTVFVEDAAPGDTAIIEVFDEKPSYARARLVKLEEASSLRCTDGPAEGFRVDGAPWAHLAYEAQLDAKRANVVAALARIAHVEDALAQELVCSCLPSQRVWGYRNKLELGAGFDENGRFQLGFYREGTHDISTPDTVFLAHEAIECAPKALRGALGRAQGSQNLGIYRVGVRHSLKTQELEVALWCPPSSFPRAHVAKIISSALPTTSIVRVLADSGKMRKIKGIEALDGTGSWKEELLGLQFETSAPSFFQVNTEQAEKLVQEVLAQLSEDSYNLDSLNLEGMCIADLYAGGGTFSIPLARAATQVVAVESAGTSVRDLRRNAEINGVDIRVIGGDAARELPQLGMLDAVVVDPPRAGLAKGVPESIAAAHPSKVIYVSCNPATWARDVSRCEEAGYRLRRVRPIDMFPQTYHVEVVSTFLRVEE